MVYDGKKDWYADLHFAIPGTYDYYLMISEGAESHRCKSGAVVVSAPVLVNGNILPLRSLCMQTVLTRSLGSLNRWPMQFQKLAQLGYNAIHFTSLNEIGGSNSAYSIKNHLTYDKALFEDEKLQEKYPDSASKEELVCSTLKLMEEQHNLIGVVDIVWNHTSSDTPWLGEHPEATYNAENCGHLRPALILDEALQKFSQDVVNGVYESKGLGRTVNDEAALTRVCQILEGEIIPSLRLWEFFVVDVENAIQEFEAAVDATERHEQTTIFLGNEVECLKKEALTRESWSRGALKVDTAWAIKLFAPSAMRRIDYSRLRQKLAEYRSALNQVNLPLYERLNDDMRSALSNIANRIRYERISADGPRMTQISPSQPLIAPYFTLVKKSGPQKPFPASSNGDSTHSSQYFHAANNGWIWGGNPAQNFAEAPGSAYLRRELIVWGDLVKLRYGAQPSDSPWLWEYMRKYTIANAKMFHGFRLDNCHSTPIHVARMMLDAARSVRPGLYVTAELFTGTEKLDNLFIAKLGINTLIRESMACKTPQELSSMIHRYGGETIASLMARFPPEFYSLESYHMSMKQLVMATTLASSLSIKKQEKMSRSKSPTDAQRATAKIPSLTDAGDAENNGGCPSNLSSSPSPDINHDTISAAGHALLASSFFSPIPPNDPRSTSNSWLSVENWFHPVQPSTPPGFLFDCTHDNQTPWQRRSGEDYLTNTALVSMARLPIGTVAGYDWIVAQNPHVDDPRLYPTFPLSEMPGIMKARLFFNQLHHRLELEGYTQIHVHQEGDLITIQRHHPHSHKAVFCIAHTAFRFQAHPNKTPASVVIPGAITKYSFCGRLSFDQSDISSFKARFRDSSTSSSSNSSSSNPKIISVIPKSGAEGHVSITIHQSDSPSPAFIEQDKTIVSRREGSPALQYEVKEGDMSDAKRYIVGTESALLETPLDQLHTVFNVRSSNQNSIECVQQLSWCDFRPGSVLVVEAQLPTEAHEAMLKLRTNLKVPMTLSSKSTHNIKKRKEEEEGKDVVGANPIITKPAKEENKGHISHLTPLDVNYALFRCDAEERSTTAGKRGVYNIPGYGDLVYAGLQGVVSVLEKVRSSKNMGHALCNNLREGNWLMDYIVSRFDDEGIQGGQPGKGQKSMGIGSLAHSGFIETSVEDANNSRDTLINLGLWLKKQFGLVKKMPRYLVPRCFDAVVMKAFTTLRHHVQIEMESNGPLKAMTPRRSTEPNNALMRALSFTSIQLVAALPSVALLDPSITGDSKRFRVTMAAGLPHFSQGYMRAWGRDTFIAFRGLLLLPGRFDIARETLIGFAATLRHGLIPNLIDSGWNPRYNARDATWWFLYALQQYCLVAPEGHNFLNDACVPRLFPHDDDRVSPGMEAAVYDEKLVTMASIVQEIMERHANGIHFRERNAGSHIDSSMSDRGFNIDIELDMETGFIFGGNAHNCGTWMDKMGSNHAAGNWGVPATPRDGAAIELVSLLKATLRWLAAISGAHVTNPLPSALERTGSRSGSLKLSALKASRDSIPSTSSASTSPNTPNTPVLTAPGHLESDPSLTDVKKSEKQMTSFFSSALAHPQSASPNANSNNVSSNTQVTTSGSFTSFEVQQEADNMKFSAPPEELPEFKLPANLPPPLFADAAKKTKASASTGLEDFLRSKKSAVSVAPVPGLPRGVISFPHQGVNITKSDGTSAYWSWSDWEMRIQANFEKSFYVPRDPRQDTQYRLSRQFIARRGIYKDTYKSSAKFTDYQLRPNQCIAMVVSPELFTPEYASEALDHIYTHLLGPLGMKTLDPADSHYRGWYDNNNHTDDYTMASGFSYHMGPEWVWLTGYFLRARLQFRSKPAPVVLNLLQRTFVSHADAAHSSDWKGLPELTNKDGAFCPGSCTTQAWSSATLLEALYDLHNY